MKGCISGAKSSLVLFLSLHIALPVQALPSFAVLDYARRINFPRINFSEFSETVTDMAKQCVDKLNLAREYILSARGFDFPISTAPVALPVPPVLPVVEAGSSSSVAKPLIFSGITLFAIGWTIKTVFYEEEASA
jgi:hypothetical protein